MASQDPPRRPRARRDLFYQDVSDGGVLFNPERDRMIVLNASAAFVWTCCDGSRDLEQIARELGEALGSAVPAAEDLLRDVRAAVQDFERQDLLEKDP